MHDTVRQKIILQIRKLLESNDYYNWMLALQLMAGQKLTKEVLGFELVFKNNLVSASGTIDKIGLNFLGKLIEGHFQKYESNEQTLRKLLIHIKEVFQLIAQQNPTPKVNFIIHISSSGYLIENHCPVKHYFFTPTKKKWLSTWKVNAPMKENWWENFDTSLGLPQKLLRSTFINIERNQV